MSWRTWADGAASAIRAAGRWRAPRDVDVNGPVAFASNDYLGLTQHPAVVSAAHETPLLPDVTRWPAG